MKSYFLSKCRLATLTLIAFISSSGWATVIEGNLEVKARTGAKGDLKVAGTTELNGTNVNGDLGVSGSLTVGGVSNASVPRGVIVMWSGDINKIPDGWALCNGEDGRPDLQGRFIVGYSKDTSDTGGDYKEIAATGGNDSIELTIVNMPKHKHNVSVTKSGEHSHSIPNGRPKTFLAGQKGPYAQNIDTTNNANDIKTKMNDDDDKGAHTHTIGEEYRGDGQAFDNRPPYYVLAYIIKL